MAILAEDSITPVSDILPSSHAESFAKRFEQVSTPELYRLQGLYRMWGSVNGGPGEDQYKGGEPDRQQVITGSQPPGRQKRLGSQERLE